MRAWKSEGASYGMHAFVLGGLTETGLLLAHGVIALCCSADIEQAATIEL
jgi:hypothetical protein